MELMEHWLDKLWREDAHSAAAASPPAEGAGTIQQVNDFIALEVEVSGLGGGVVAESTGHPRLLLKDKPWCQTHRCAIISW